MTKALNHGVEIRGGGTDQEALEGNLLCSKCLLYSSLSCYLQPKVIPTTLFYFAEVRGQIEARRLKSPVKSRRIEAKKVVHQGTVLLTKARKQDDQGRDHQKKAERLASQERSRQTKAESRGDQKHLPVQQSKIHSFSSIFK